MQKAHLFEAAYRFNHGIDEAISGLHRLKRARELSFDKYASEAAELEHSRSDMNIFFLTELRRSEKAALPALSETADALLTFGPDDEEACREMREVEKRRKLEGLPPMVQFLMPDPDADPEPEQEDPHPDAPDQAQAATPAPPVTATS